MISALGGDDKPLIYLSVPITSGPRHFAFLKDGGDPKSSAWCISVKQENTRDAQTIAKRLRSDRPDELILNPAEIELRNWSQNDYNAFWLDIIANRVSEVVAGPGWAWSNGARFEIAAAIYYAIPVSSPSGERLDENDLVEEAMKAERQVARSGPFGQPAPALRPLNVDHIPLEPSAQMQAFDWLQVERSYQLAKFGSAQDDEHTENGIGVESWWQHQFDNYLHRARLLGLELPNGRQALAKFVATAVGLLESTIRVYGPLPDAGVTSGEVHFAQAEGDLGERSDAPSVKAST